VKVEAGVLHVDESGVEPCMPDDLDDLRVRYPPDMGSQGEAAVVEDSFYPVLFHGSPPLLLAADARLLVQT
jgi:hypothetical protein